MKVVGGGLWNTNDPQHPEPSTTHHITPRVTARRAMCVCVCVLFRLEPLPPSLILQQLRALFCIANVTVFFFGTT